LVKSAVATAGGTVLALARLAKDLGRAKVLGIAALAFFDLAIALRGDFRTVNLGTDFFAINPV
jgi:hypothetical protein